MASAVPEELTKPAFLFEVVRHLYRWYVDEAEVERVIKDRQFVFWVQSLAPALDAGDRSLFGAILLPQFDLRVKVKKTDYTIEELHTVLRSPNFKITQVLRESAKATKDKLYTIVTVNTQEMIDYLFRTRNQREYPDAALLERMREALRKEFATDRAFFANIPPGEQIVHLAPLSPVANEAWVFWETGHKLLHFASDIDLANPAVWQHESLMVQTFDLDQQVVFSHQEAPGSNRFLTRYQVSRALFNCIVLGERVELTPGRKAELELKAGAQAENRRGPYAGVSWLHDLNVQRHVECWCDGDVVKGFETLS
jgi:hypothetical protein